MKVSIVGARRARNGIGEYIGRFFHKNGARVSSVLGTTEQTSLDAASWLKKYGIDALPYTDFLRMVEKESPDAVVIASPSSTHYEYLVKCIDAGVHVFCEKPFFWLETGDVLGLTESLLETARSKKLTIAMNSQWPFAIQFYEKLCGCIDAQKADTFFIKLCPTVRGKEMIPESVPHALSILYFVIGRGDLENLRLEVSQRRILITFTWVSDGNNCEVLVELVEKKRQPRQLLFGFNGKIVNRTLDLKTYDIYFNYNTETLRIVDPVELSVRDFIGAVSERREPVIGYSHILSNMSSLKEIYDRFVSTVGNMNGTVARQRA